MLILKCENVLEKNVFSGRIVSCCRKNLFCDSFGSDMYEIKVQQFTDKYMICNK